MSHPLLEGLPLGHFRLVMADPAWNFKAWSAKGLGKSAKAHYPCMNLEEIKALPVGDHCAKDAILVLWGTFPMMREALDTVDAWGFKFSTGGAWAKQSSTGEKWSFGGGHVLRSAAELFIIARRGKPRFPEVATLRNLIVAPVRGHSVKPEHIYDLCETLSPGPYLELFARRHRRGWISRGNQLA